MNNKNSHHSTPTAARKAGNTFSTPQPIFSHNSSTKATILTKKA